MESSVSGLTESAMKDSAISNQMLQDIVKRTETVKQAYQNDKASLQKLQDKTSALQKDTTVQDNLAILCKQIDAITKKLMN
eukprot:2352480-Ditylum_brightwellii.AAC.1